MLPTQLQISRLASKVHEFAPMLYEIARAIVQRVLRDKILLGLVVIGVLGIFVGGMTTKKEPAVATKEAAVDTPEAAIPAQPPVDAKLASDFVKWWMGGAFDYAPASALQSHEQAFGWMTPDAKFAFQSAFWNQEMAQGISSGKLVAAFHPTVVQAEAINPDGSVVVGASGTLITQSSGPPVTHQVLADFLVKRDQDGLRVAGVYNRVTTLPGSSVY